MDIKPNFFSFSILMMHFDLYPTFHPTLNIHVQHTLRKTGYTWIFILGYSLNHGFHSLRLPCANQPKHRKLDPIITTHK